MITYARLIGIKAVTSLKQLPLFPGGGGGGGGAHIKQAVMLIVSLSGLRGVFGKRHYI